MHIHVNWVLQPFYTRNQIIEYKYVNLSIRVYLPFMSALQKPGELAKLLVSRIITVIKSNIPSDLSIWYRTSFPVSREGPVLRVPLEKFLAHAHPLDVLALVRIRLEQHEGCVSGKHDGVCSVSVCATAVLNQRVVSVFTIWHRISIAVVIVWIFIVPPYISFRETCWK